MAPLRATIRTAVMLGVALALAIPACAEDIPLPEPDALKLRILVLERDLIVSRFQTMKAQADFAHADKQGQIDALTRALAEREGIDLDTYQIDPAKGVWKPKPERKETTR